MTASSCPPTPWHSQSPFPMQTPWDTVSLRQFLNNEKGLIATLFTAWVGLVLLLAGLILLHLFVAPYTKVEESFHVQATHDILAHGFPYGDNIDRSHYDHFEFPGAVPRTAVGATILAGLLPSVTATWAGVSQQILSMEPSLLLLCLKFLVLWIKLTTVTCSSSYPGLIQCRSFGYFRPGLAE